MVVKMKITIEIDECADYGLLPYTVYSKLRKEEVKQTEHELSRWVQLRSGYKKNSDGYCNYGQCTLYKWIIH